MAITKETSKTLFSIPIFLVRLCMYQMLTKFCFTNKIQNRQVFGLQTHLHLGKSMPGDEDDCTLHFLAVW